VNVPVFRLFAVTGIRGNKVVSSTFLLLLFLWGPSAYASGSTSALWLIVLSPYWTFQFSPRVPRCPALLLLLSFALLFLKKLNEIIHF
jgi:hypothetical protein